MGETMFDRLFGRARHYWGARGIDVAPRKDSDHRRATHADRYSKTVSDKRKARRKMANASRRRNR